MISNLVPHQANPVLTSTQMINAFILEDEPNSLDLLLTYLASYCPNVNVVGTGQSVKSGIKIIQETKERIDVAFLDIKLTDGLVFDMFDQIENVNFDVIFITAWNSYVRKACDFYSIGYLLKPLALDELKAAVSRVRVKPKEESNLALQSMIEQMRTPNTFNKLIIPTTDGMSFIKVADILYLEGDDNYTYIHTPSEKLMTSRTVKVFDEILAKLNFVRIHKKYLINLNNMDKYFKGDGYVKMVNGDNLQVSKRRKAGFLNILRNGFNKI